MGTNVYMRRIRLPSRRKLSGIHYAHGHTGKHAIFDCRLIPLPIVNHVVDYFRWRQEDAHRNSLNSHCYWALRKDGVSANEAQKRMSRISNSKQNEILFDRGINYNDLPSWQKRGIGLFYRNEQRQGFNPITKETTSYTRRALHVEIELPIGQEYSKFLYTILEDMNKENFTRTTPAVPCCSAYQSNSRQWQR